MSEDSSSDSQRMESVSPGALRERSDELRQIADVCLGAGYLDAGQFESAIDAAGPSKVLALVVDTGDERPTVVRPTEGVDAGNRCLNGDLVGFSVGAVRSPDELASYLELSRSKWPPALESAAETAVLQTIAVHPEWQGHGHGHRLLDAHVKALETASPDAWCAVAWTRPDGSIPGGSLLRSVGLSLERTIEAYWQAESLAEGYRCATCGAPPCQCDATLFIRDRAVDRSRPAGETLSR